MSRAARPHLPVRPIWLCRVCGHPWPCGEARLSLLVEYRGNRTALLIYLATLKEEATVQLTELRPGRPPGDLTDRFIYWARARGQRLLTGAASAATGGNSGASRTTSLIVCT